MSSEDVIEVESSDEERQPASKKRKCTPNAMVCIPRKLHDVILNRVKPNTTLPNLSSKIATVSPKCYNVVPNTNKVNGKPQVTVFKTVVGYNPHSNQQKPKQIFNQNKPGSSKVHNQNKPSNSKVLNQNKPGNSKVPLVRQGLQKPNLTKIPTKQTVQLLKMKNIRLPPNITVTKTIVNKPKIMLKTNIKNVKQINAVAASEDLTLNLDDDEASVPSSVSPQWYIRPEDQKEIPNAEEENNKEPTKGKFVEIVIDDSPVKSIKSKRTNKVGSELAIVIDDSPVKVIAEKEKAVSEHENDDDNNDKTNNREPQSKKKLLYPSEADSNKTIEIEIDLGPCLSVDPNVKEKIKEVEDTCDIQKELNDKPEEMPVVVQDELTTKDEKAVLQDNDQTKFHPVYQSFIDLCFQLENTDDMKKIVENKIKKYYRQVPKEYTESEEFTDMVSTKILSMKAGPEKMYLYIKDIVDELKLQRNLAKMQPVVETPKTNESVELSADANQYSTKRQRQIRKLEKTIKKLHRAIQKLEEQEVDFDDEDDSVYLLTERYKERMVRVHAKFCQLTNTKMPSEPRIQIDARLGQPSGPAKRLEKWINKKVPIGTPLPFPDFHDVLRCVRQANEEDRLGYNEADIIEEARDLFTRCGRKLQRRRQENEWRLAVSRITVDTDPAEKDAELQKKLSENKKVAHKEDEIFNKFADKQNQLKLEGEEIGDKEAEESPVESEEEEETNDVTSVDRKKRLKRLIQEQSRKSCEEKENGNNHTSIENQNEMTKATDNDVNEDIVMEKEIDTEKKTALETESEVVTVPETVAITETVIDPETPSVAETTTERISENNETDTKNKAAVETGDTAKIVMEDISDKKNAEDADHNVEQSNKKKPSENATETFTISESELDSDMDELHLLHKLNKSYEGDSSTVDTSDSESAIAISDSLQSSEDDRKEDDEDIISIENSSYSEDNGSTNVEMPYEDAAQNVRELPQQDDEKSASVDNNTINSSQNVEVIQAPVYTTNDEYSGPVEDILLASTEEENSQDGTLAGECFNLRDDLISIDETVVGPNKVIEIPIENNRITIHENESNDNNSFNQTRSPDTNEI